MRAVNVWVQEDGIHIDKIMQTTTSSYIPSGTGPAESVRGPVYVYDGDDNRVQAVEAGKITAYPGSHYEVEVSGGITTTAAITTPGRCAWRCASMRSCTSCLAITWARPR